MVKLPLPGIFRFPANCHAPSVLLLLLIAQAIDGFAKGSVNFHYRETHRRVEAI
jgi:hypothetical protein